MNLNPVELLREPDGISVSTNAPHYNDLFVTWGVGPTTDARGGLALESQINVRVLFERLEGHEEQYDTMHCMHWGWGWVTHLVYQVIEPIPTEYDARIQALEQDLPLVSPETKECVADTLRVLQLAQGRAQRDTGEYLESYPGYRFTKVAHILFEWMSDIEETCVLDDAEYYAALYEQALDCIRGHNCNYKVTLPHDWERDIEAQLRKNGVDTSSVSDGSVWIRRDDVQTAADQLGYTDNELS